MRKLVFCLMVTLSLMISCTNSVQDKLIGKYWFEPEDEEILFFDENGVVYETVYQEKSTYSVKDDSLLINISGWGDSYYSIREITNDKLILVSSKEDVWELIPAKTGDFLNGEWEGKLFNKDMNLEFSEGNLTIENYDATWEEDDIIYDDLYRVEENKIIASSDLYTFNFELSENRNELTLIQGDNKYIFKRD